MPLVVYKSSAGSGKTTTLVKSYLKITLNNPHLFRNVLAITFTNKAANEMKKKVLDSLKIFADGKTNEYPELIEFQNELNLSDELLQQKAKKLLSLIIHQYDEFSISTIDSFVHRIIKTFATDVKLPQNFEVVIDEDEIIPEIVQELYDKVGVDKDITDILVNFVISNFEDEKSHDPTSQIYGFIQKQIKEEGFQYIRKMLHLSLSDFQKIIGKLRREVLAYKKEIREIGNKALDLINKAGIEPSGFYQGQRGIYLYFSKISRFNANKDLVPGKNALTTIEEDKWYGGKSTQDQKAEIDKITDQLEIKFETALALSKKYVIYSLLYERIYDVALIKEIRVLFDDYAARNQKVHISEFNKKISESIAEQPVPFIYERLGRRYQYFLIDEFQDTSVLQWQNFLPLIEESLAYGHFNMLVGDAKQAIYRFRNGEVELFSSLPKLYPEAKSLKEKTSENLLVDNYEEVVLKHNFRSQKVIIDFNNRFFESVKDGLSEKNNRVYKGHTQLLPEKDDKSGGYVNIEFIEAENIEGYRAKRLEKIGSDVDLLIDKGYKQKDICVLTNKNEYAAEIATYLIGKSYRVISHESLLLKNADEVRLAIAFFKLVLNNEDKIQLATFVENLLQHRHDDHDFHSIYNNALLFIDKGLEAVLNELGYKISEKDIAGKSAYELAEYAIETFFGPVNNNIFLHYFLDFAFENQNIGDGSLASFLDHWEKKSDKAYISMPKGKDAIQVMTIHKAKGLKFESVIVDFIPRDSSKTKKDYWTELNFDEFSDLKVGMYPIKNELDFVGLEHINVEEVDKTELDLLNMIYVAFTRSVSALFILSHKAEKKQNRFTSYIQKFLTSQKNDSEELIYEFGSLSAEKTKSGESCDESTELKNMQSSSWKGKIKIAPSEEIFWKQIESKPAITYGKLVHKMLSEIVVKTDVDRVINKYHISGIIDENEAAELKNKLNSLVRHKELSQYFSNEVINRNESELITVDRDGKKFQRPDRVVIKDDKLIIIDYKTGEKDKKHENQVSKYAMYFNELGYKSVKKLLVYINEDIEIVSI